MSRAKAEVKIQAAAAPQEETAIEPAATEAPAEIPAAKPQPSSKQSKKEVRAKIYFGDALTGKNYQAGDLIEGWDDERVALYAERGLVVVSINVGPSEFK